jgi:2-dehydropantoate 2-reductase
MKFLCFGLGAIGVYIGGSLISAGNEVIFIAKPGSRVNQLDQIEVTTPSKRTIHSKLIQMTSIDQALKFMKFDYAIAAVKSYDTEGLVTEIKPFSAAFPALLCLQNGVENEDRFRVILGNDRVIAGTVTTSVGKKQLGVVVVEKLRGIGIGSHNGVEDLIRVMNAAGLNVSKYQETSSMKWSKLLTNLLANASSAILNMTPADIFSHQKLFHLEVEQIREALKIMKALGLRVVNLPGTPVMPLALILKNFSPSFSRRIVSKVMSQGRGRKMPSLYLDLKQGKLKSEVRDLNGAVVRFGNRLGISTPVNYKLEKVLLSLIGNTDLQMDFAGNLERLVTN